MCVASGSYVVDEAQYRGGTYVMDPMKHTVVCGTSAGARRTDTAARVERRRREL